MINDLNWSFKSGSFSQRHGYDTLPECMRLEHLSESARTEVYNIIYDILTVSGVYENYVTSPVIRMSRYAIALSLNKKIREIGASGDEILDQLQSIVYESSFNKVLDILEYMANYRDDQNYTESHTMNNQLIQFPKNINKAFDRKGVAYSFDILSEPFKIYPRTSMEQGIAIQNAVDTLKNHGHDSPTTHLQDAAAHLNSGEFADAIADSIHAVESVLCFYDPEKNPKLSTAIDWLQSQGIIKHKALAKAIKSLYGYTSDEKGVRHALIFEKKANVDMNDAMFMFGACASLAAYLANICRNEMTQIHI